MLLKATTPNHSWYENLLQGAELRNLIGSVSWCGVLGSAIVSPEWGGNRANGVESARRTHPENGGRIGVCDHSQFHSGGRMHRIIISLIPSALNIQETVKRIISIGNNFTDPPPNPTHTHTPPRRRDSYYNCIPGAENWKGERMLCCSQARVCWVLCL